MTPYYADDAVTLYHGDCREVKWPADAAWVTDPPYPNNAGHFDAAVWVARVVLDRAVPPEAIVFWSELERPPLRHGHLVAVHIWHRTNVNGRPYEPAYHFTALGKKRRSEVLASPAIFDGAGPGCREYLGHPTQKPLAVMQRLVSLTTEGTVFDPFAGSGSTLVAAKNQGKRAIGVELGRALLRDRRPPTVPGRPRLRSVGMSAAPTPTLTFYGLRLPYTSPPARPPVEAEAPATPSPRQRAAGVQLRGGAA